MPEVEETEAARNGKKIRLLVAVRNKNRKEALKLLKEGAGVDSRDDTGSYPLHYAASEGYDDVIEMLLDKGAKAMAWNLNGHTALHMAAMHGHAGSVLRLVAGGAVLWTLDHKECLALDYAIRYKHMDAVKLLCQFGSERSLTDRVWTSQYSPKETEKKIANLLQQHGRRLPGYRHKGIILDVTRVTPGDGPLLHLENTGVDIKVSEGQKSYYLYLSKAEESYGSPPPLGPDEQVFGHLLECQSWGSQLKTITLTVTVDRVLQNSEEIVLRPATLNGVVDKVAIQDEKHARITKVTMCVRLKRNEITCFTMVSRAKKQIFKISEKAVVLKPESEPEVEIDIPAGTFSSGELSVKFVDTKDAHDELDEQDDKDRDESGDDPILLTNILDICTTDGQKPQKDIQMKLPVNVKLKSKGVVVLVTSNPDPNLEKWDWEVIPAKIDGTGKAVFTVKHFSSNVLISKSQFDADPEGVKDLSRNVHLKNRKVEFFVALKTPEVDESKTDMIVICGTKRQIQAARKTYDESFKCFHVGQNNDLPMVPEGQTFKIVIRGNVKERNDDDNMKLKFKRGNQDGSRALEIVSTCPEPRELSGELEILKESKCHSTADDKDTEKEANTGRFLCFRCSRGTKVTVEGSEVKPFTPSMCTIPFNVVLTKLKPGHSREGRSSLNDSMKITWGKLKDAVGDLLAEESKQLGFQLGFSAGLMSQVEEDTMDDRDLAMNVIKKWHLLLAKNDMVSQLRGALEAIGRRDLIQKIKHE